MNAFRKTMRTLLTLTLLLTTAATIGAQVPEGRPMTWMDVQLMARAGSWTPSPDGQWMLYAVTRPNWEDAESYSDLWIVSLREGLSSGRQLTFTEKKDESRPAWSPDGSYFVFASNRESENGRHSQLFMMRPDGGEARRITDAAEGVSDFKFSPDGGWLVYRSGPSGETQLWIKPTSDLAGSSAEALTDEPAGIDQWEFSPDGRGIYFTRPDSVNHDEQRRRSKGFTVDIKNAATPLSQLYRLQLAGRVVSRMTEDPNVSVDRFTMSPDGRWIAYRGGSAERYERNITQAGLYADIFLLETPTGHVERLTENHEVPEGMPSFSPDSRWIAFSAPDDMTHYTMTEDRVYLRDASDRGGEFRKLGSLFDGSVDVDFWSQDGRTIYFTTGVKVTTQLFALDTRSGSVRQITKERAALRVSRDEDTGTLLIDYSDPTTPPTVFTVDEIGRVDQRSRWVQLVDVNPEVKDMALGREEEVEWTSTDGKTVGGVLVYPVGYREGLRYPLIVAIHGGPASADVLRFNGGYGAQVYAGAGYAVLKPNYRGSTNYGNAHRTDIVGDYFTLGFDDIMTGVDYLIERGIVDGDRLGALGWSAGGHWSNWILTHTDRFKAISSGAGTMNWISMYAQSDVQRNRQFYLGDGFMYDDFEPYWDQSPLKYVQNAKTPTMIHVVEGDPRVPSPQSVELHMALKQLGVPTELFMYPGRSHGIPDPRNRLVKSVAEMAWMDYYVRGIGEKFQWRQVLETLEGPERPRAVSEDARH
jgi:dipeptidyl aminopeptidase/acylaminoacyl peptidase